ncbi:Trypsin [Armatimonadetes bacterium DC]|nr:Trypsin [Armatimonadetes bacterium DC]
MWNRANFWRGVSLLVVASVIHGAAWSIVRRHDVPDSQYQLLGASALAATVGRVIGSNASGSGTVIANGRWVLTAAHVVYNNPNLVFQLGASTYTVQNVYIHPNYNPSDLMYGGDIALLELSAPVVGVTPALINTSFSPIGLNSISVGYGATGTGLTGYTTYDGRRRGMTNVVDAYLSSYNNSTEWILSDFDHPTDSTYSTMGSSMATPFEGLVAPGDSGGPVFIQVGTNRYIAGVHSFIAAPLDYYPNASYGDIQASTNVALYAG